MNHVNVRMGALAALSAMLLGCASAFSPDASLGPSVIIAVCVRFVVCKTSNQAVASLMFATVISYCSRAAKDPLATNFAPRA